MISVSKHIVGRINRREEKELFKVMEEFGPRTVGINWPWIS